MTEEKKAFESISVYLGLTAYSAVSGKDVIIEKINELVLHDMERLINILYRMDVSEQKIEQLLRAFPGTDAAEIIAALMIEREAEKIKSRELARRQPESESDEEKW